MSIQSVSRQPQLWIVSPTGYKGQRGNTITACRWQKILQSLGVTCYVGERWKREDVDALVALHAQKSAESVESFHKAHPHRPILIALTGTDIYGNHKVEQLDVLKFASRILALQPLALQRLPDNLQTKGVVIYQSVETRGLHHAPPEPPPFVL